METRAALGTRYARVGRESDRRGVVSTDRKLDCWEYKECGRQPGGERVSELGVCAAAGESRLDGHNDGTMGGRSCWVVPGTLCSGVACSSFDEKYPHCRKCDFFELVQLEQGDAYEGYVSLLLLIARGAETDA